MFKGNMDFKYKVEYGTIHKVPDWVLIINDFRMHSNIFFYFLLSLVIFIYEKASGKKLIYGERTIAIYKKVSFFRRELIYEEKIPEGLSEWEVIKTHYQLEKAAEKDEIEDILELFINGEKRIFVTNGVQNGL